MLAALRKKSRPRDFSFVIVDSITPSKNFEKQVVAGEGIGFASKQRVLQASNGVSVRRLDSRRCRAVGRSRDEGIEIVRAFQLSPDPASGCPSPTYALSNVTTSSLLCCGLASVTGSLGPLSASGRSKGGPPQPAGSHAVLVQTSRIPNERGPRKAACSKSRFRAACSPLIVEAFHALPRGGHPHRVTIVSNVALSRGNGGREALTIAGDCVTSQS